MTVAPISTVVYTIKPVAIAMIMQTVNANIR